MNIPSVFGEPLVEAARPALVNAWAVGYSLWRLGNPGSVGAVPVLLRDLPRGRALRVESTAPRVHVMIGVYVDDVLLGWYQDTAEIPDKQIRSILREEMPGLADILEAIRRTPAEKDA